MTGSASLVDFAAIRAQFRPGPGITYLDTATYGLPAQATVDAIHQAELGLAGRRGRLAVGLGHPDRRGPAILRVADRCVARHDRDDPGILGGDRAGGRDARGRETRSSSRPTNSPRRCSRCSLRRSGERRSARWPSTISRRPSGRRRRSWRSASSRCRPGASRISTAILAAAEQHGARVLTDATQGIPFVSLDAVIDRIDYLVCSGYKHLLSPRGTAYLYVRRDHWDELEPRNANWRAADLPFVRYFGGPLTLAPDARRFDVSRGWFPWVGATAALRLLVEWKAAGAFGGVLDLAEGLAKRLRCRGTADPWSALRSRTASPPARRFRPPGCVRRSAGRRSASPSTSTTPRTTSIEPLRRSRPSREPDAPHPLSSASIRRPFVARGADRHRSPGRGPSPRGCGR